MNDQIRMLARQLYSTYYTSKRGVDAGQPMLKWEDLSGVSKMHWLEVAREAISQLG